MIYCVVMCLVEGLVFVLDFWINVGFDQIFIFCKMYVFEQVGECGLVLLFVGNLVISQSVISLFECWVGIDVINVLNISFMFEIVEIVGQIMCEVICWDNLDGKLGYVDFSCFLILGGQIKGEEFCLFNIYLEGNFIEVIEEMFYFQIGELKYGKLIIDWVVNYCILLEWVYQCVLIFFDLIMKSNLLVGMFLDIVIYWKDELKLCLLDWVEEQFEYFYNLW